MTSTSQSFNFCADDEVADYYPRDHLGSVREMVNGSGAVVARYGYDPYGRTILLSGPKLATFQYASYYQHQMSGLYFTLFRSYDPNTGRWLSRDRIQEKGGINLYEYCRNIPLGLVDLLGLEGTRTFTIITNPSFGRPVINASYEMSTDEKKCCNTVSIFRYVLDMFGFGYHDDNPPGDSSGGGLPGNNHGQAAHAQFDVPGGESGGLLQQEPTSFPRDFHFKWKAVCTSGKLAGKTLSTREKIYHQWWYGGYWLTPQGDGSYSPTP